MQLHAQANHVESALLQVADIAAQFLIIHLSVLFHFLLEIRGRLADFGEGRDIEGVIAVGGDGGAVQRTVPALFIDPAVQVFGPVGAVGVDASRDGEGRAVEFKDRDVAELIAIGIEELVVVDVIVLAENPPAVGAQVGLRRLAFDLIVQGFLALVGVGQVELVGEEQSHA